MAPIDLNRPPGDECPEDRDHGRRNGPVEAVFRNHRGRVLTLFNEAREHNLGCLGAVAWATDPEILAAMATIPTSLVVQKEDLWRPDIPVSGNLKAWRARLRRRYESIEASDSRTELGVPFDRLHMPRPLCDMSYGEDRSVAGVRCCGVRNGRAGDPRDRPLMHNKFLLFVRGVVPPMAGCEVEEDPDLDAHWRVEAVWTGSYNLSRLAPRSRENSIIIRDPVIGDAYLREWAEIMALSEPLGSDSEWVDPEWRLGT